MKIYEGRRLEFVGGQWSGGGLDGCCNGGGMLANSGQLEISANPLPAFRNTVENNALLRVLPSAYLAWNHPSGGGLLANLTTTANPAMIQLDDTGRIGGVVTLVNEGIVCKTGSGTSVVHARLRNVGITPLYPGEIAVLGGTLAIADLFVFEGSGRLEVSGGQLLTDNYSQFRGTILLDQATLASPNPTIYLREESTLGGVGTVATSQLEHRGLLEPGTPYGAIVVTGTLLQNGFNPPLPTTRIAIGGPTALSQYAQIQVAGDVRPFGFLRVNFRDGYAPAPGAHFDLITVGGALTDALSRYQVIIKGLAPGFLYNLSLSPQNAVRLTALNQGISLADLILCTGFED